MSFGDPPATSPGPLVTSAPGDGALRDPAAASSEPLVPAESSAPAGSEAVVEATPVEIATAAEDTESLARALRRRRDRVLGLSILGLSFAGSMALSLWAKDETTPRAAPPPAPPTTMGVPGFPARVRPHELVERARSLSVRSLLQGFDAEGVRADGTMDFSAKGTALRFAFQSPRGHGPQPARAGGTLPERTYCGLQSVSVGPHGIAAEKDDMKVACSHKEPRALPPPDRCTVTDVWAVARSRHIDDGGTARIEYFWAEAGPAYRFTKEEKKKPTQRFVISAKDCKKLFGGKQQRGSVP